jgi:hypothetical protein
MPRRTSNLLISLAVLVSLSACSKSRGGANGLAPPEGAVSSASVVKASADAVQIPAGNSANATVHLTIQAGYHLNANPASESYLRATELLVEPTDGISVGFITYPTGITKAFSFSKKPLAVYEGETTIKVMLKAASSASKGQRSFPTKLNIQACDDQVCYPPAVVELKIPVTVN